MWRSLKSGEIPADGERVFYRKHFAGVMTYHADLGVQWYLDRDYDLWMPV